MALNSAILSSGRRCHQQRHIRSLQVTILNSCHCTEKTIVNTIIQIRVSIQRIYVVIIITADSFYQHYFVTATFMHGNVGGIKRGYYTYRHIPWTRGIEFLLNKICLFKLGTQSSETYAYKLKQESLNRESGHISMMRRQHCSSWP